MLTFKKHFLFLTITLFIIELFIALFVRDHFIRPLVGDFLVVILIYCFIRTFIRSSALLVAIFTLTFAFAVEFSQYFHLIKVLGLEDNFLAQITLGSGYDTKDLVAYTLGVATIYFIEQVMMK